MRQVGDSALHLIYGLGMLFREISRNLYNCFSEVATKFADVAIATAREPNRAASITSPLADVDESYNVFNNKSNPRKYQTFHSMKI